MSIDTHFVADLWESSSEAAWVFVSLPAGLADDIDELVPPKGGFGSVRVGATIGNTTWSTSIFPDKKRGTYVLPVKKQVRAAESVGVGDEVSVRLRIETD